LLVLLAISPGQPRQVIALGGTVPADAVWLDLLDPTEEERRSAEQASGMRLPTQNEILEIESSSRLRQEGEGIYLSMPVTAPHADGSRTLTALGLVLCPKYLLTLRYAELPVFDAFANSRSLPHGGAGMFVGLLEALVDRLADVLEHVSADLDALSRRIFHTDGQHSKPRREDVLLRATLRRIGLAGDLVSNLRASLLGIGRIVPYVSETAAAWLPAELKPRLASLKQDILSLADFDSQLMSKVQFLLDATLGFLNIEQNNGLKVLTIVSVVGIPPTLIASMYGMNFKYMPELQWAWGYPYGLTMIALSIVLPLVWFRVKGWL
jgi:magnesium transporter